MLHEESIKAEESLEEGVKALVSMQDDVRRIADHIVPQSPSISSWLCCAVMSYVVISVILSTLTLVFFLGRGVEYCNTYNLFELRECYFTAVKSGLTSATETPWKDFFL